MAAEYNQDQSSGFRSELDEPRRTTDQVNTGEFGAGEGQRQGDVTEGGYGGVSEQEPPRHKIHTDEEKLPMPAPGTYDEELPSSQPDALDKFGSAEQREEGQEVVPKPTGYGDAPRNTEGYEEYRDTEPTKFDEAPVETQPRSEGAGVEGATNEGYADPSAAFPGAPVDRKVEEPGYGYDNEGSAAPVDSTTPTETGAPKKEGLITKIKEKLPGHHKSADAEEPDTSVDETAGAPPKKGLLTKIKEKLPGHHKSADTAV